MPVAARILTLSMTAAITALSAICARADSVADFYRGKTLDMVVGTTPGNDFDYRGRLLARHMGRHIPGQPNIVARNMPGGGGVVAMNWLANVAPHDGTVLHMVFPAMGTQQAVASPGIDFDMRKFFLIGNTTDSPNALVAWHTAGVRTIDDAKKKQLVLGSSPGNTGTYYAYAMNAMIGTKFKVISGYPGGNEINLAIERGEVEGRASNTWASWHETKPEWIRDKKLVVLFQVGVKRHPDLPDIPLMTELATNDDDRRVLEFFSASVAIARSVVTTPGVPPDRVEALRRAFDATMKDPAFIAEATKANLDMTPLPGEEAQKISDSIINAPPDVVARAKKYMDAP
jgi:tripartite-type tricarboxylate transporter receptor subunit TctC